MKLVFGLLLTAIAGWIDAIAFLHLSGFYTSFMSGNTTQLGVGLAQNEQSAILSLSLLLAAFFAGSFGGSLLSSVSGQWRLPSVLALVSALLTTAVVLFVRTDATSVPAWLLAGAMGAQNAALTQVRGTRVGMTFVTGYLFNAGQDLAKALLGEGSRWSWLMHLLGWSSLVVGALGGTALYGRVGHLALAVPALLVMALMVMTLAGVSMAGPRKSSSS